MSADHFQTVLERLISSLCDNPREVEVRRSSLKGREAWVFNCAADDIGKVVAKRGVRLRALRLIVAVAGLQRQEDWHLSPAEEAKGERTPGGSAPAEIPELHNALPDLNLLQDLLNELKIAAHIEVQGDVDHGFRFSIAPVLIQDNTALLEPYAALYSQSQPETQPLNLISALGCVWRSVGARAGVRYGVQIAQE